MSDRNYEIPFGLDIKYNVRDDIEADEDSNSPFIFDVIKFSFDGDKFIGDYEKLDELINLRKK
jgi:hypothetical protein